MGSLRRACAKVREPSELRFGVVRGVDRGIVVSDGAQRRARGRGDLGVLFPDKLFYSCLLYTSDAADE